MKFMLSELKKAGIGIYSFVNPIRKLPLHAMISSCGYQTVQAGDDYCFDGLKRGGASFFLWQFTLAGQGMLRFEGREYVQDAGKAMLLRIPHDHSYWLPDNSDSWEFVYFCLHGSEIMRILQQLQIKTGCMMEFAEDSPLLETVMEICHQAQGGDIATSFDNSSLAYRFAMDLVKEKMPRHQGTEKPDFIRKVEDFCRANLSDQVGVDEMAVAAAYSRYHFSRMFTEFKGVSPALYLRNLRLQEAANMLNDTMLSVKEIADVCGFPDCSHFCRLFRESYGITPESFRKSGMY